MNTNIIKYLLVSASIVSAIVCSNEIKAIAQTTSNPEKSISQIEEYNNINSAEDSLDQVTDVNQLTDVKTTDWAYESLKSLVERYGCLPTLPNNTYQGDRAITRYEFASGLNACLAQIEKLIAASTSNFIRKEDLATLGKLKGDFSPELAVINKRLDSLEASTEKLEKSQFSTTTKLNGEVVTVLNGVASGSVEGNDINQNTALGSRARLNFDTSFTGEDLLRTRLQINNQSSLSSITGTPEGNLRFNAEGSGDNNVQLDALFYSFPLGKKTNIVIEANGAGIDDFTNTVNPYFDGDGEKGALSNFGARNSIYYIASGNAGIGIKHQFSDSLELSVSYLAGNPNDPSSGNGLFNGSYGLFGQLTVKPSEQLTLGFSYVNSYNQNIKTGSNRANLITTLGNVSSNSYGVQASWQFSPKFALGGWVGYSNNQIISETRGSAEIWTWAVNLAFPDLGKKGNLGGIIVGMEPKVTSVSNSLSAFGKDGDTSLHIEGFYQHQLSDNIAITPGIIWLTAPDHNEGNKDLVIGVIRTTFTF